ncbi:hypothetical protein NWE60_06850 [Mycoplasmopsis felis]|nr:hypothetical protein [Mycoplasmopsis felis]WAM01061.1 hypothetical protein NWE60_06850 [Mycoplasmopsis felis]
MQICIIDKRRTGVNQTEVMGILGNIEVKMQLLLMILLTQVELY